MTVEIRERFGSQTLSQSKTSSGTIKYILLGTNVRDTLYAKLAATAPTTFRGWPLRTLSIDEQLANDCWAASAQYGDEERQAGQFTYNFEIGTENQHIEVALPVDGGPEGDDGTFDQSPSADDINMKGVINYDGTKVNGVDILVPKYTFSETHIIPRATVTDSFKETLAAMVGTVHNGGTSGGNTKFRGFAGGEVLFAGVQGTEKGLDNWEITYRFMISKNNDHVKVVGLDVVNKPGWYYLWVLYDDKVDGTGEYKGLRKVPKAVFVDRVYPESDFSTIPGLT